MERRRKMAKQQRQKVGTKKPKTTVKKTTTKKPASKRAAPVVTGIKKEYLKSKDVCKVTFRFPKVAAPGAKSVCIVGDFNDWNIYANPMKKMKNGNYSIMLQLKPGREYHFRYLIDESKWENDWNADKYVKSPFGDSDNSVIVL
jgi:1,4-alpha-glucan branching enzyme